MEVTDTRGDEEPFNCVLRMMMVAMVHGERVAWGGGGSLVCTNAWLAANALAGVGEVW